jgi:hypothetical protein
MLNDILEILKTLGAPAVLGFVVIAWIKIRLDKQEQRGDARKEESVLTMRWMMSAGSAIQEMAVVIKKLGGNGELSTAVEDVAECGQNIETYLIEQNAKKNH